MKAKKISHLVALHTLLSASAGIMLAFVLFSGFLKLEKQQYQISDEAVIVKDIQRMEESYRQWLVMMDLILGNRQTYLAAGAKRQADFFMGIAGLIHDKPLAADVRSELGKTVELVQPHIRMLEQVIAGGLVKPGEINAFDNESLLTLELLAHIKNVINTQARQNANDFKQQRRQLVVKLVGAIAIFIVIIVVQWGFLFIYLVRPVQRLTKAVDSVRKAKTQFQYANNEGPVEIRRLANHARTFINHLQKIIAEHTALLQVERDKAVSASRVKSNFLALMNHELRTPLHAITGFAQLLSFEEDLPEELLDYQEEILVASKKLLRLIDRIFEAIDIDGEEFELSMEKTSVNMAICQAVDAMEGGFRQKNIRLEQEIQDDVVIMADFQYLTEIFMNLLANAVKYSHDNGVIRIACQKRQRRMEFSIKDEGVGISPEFARNIFTLFVEQQHNFVDGLGISLYISKRLVEKMNGEIQFDSIEGEGSTFYLHFPLA